MYRHIGEDRQCGGSLWKCLRKRQRQRKNRGRKLRDRQRFGERGIQERPAIVESRQHASDWKGDAIVGMGSTRIVTLVERKSGLLCMGRVDNGEAGPTPPDHPQGAPPVPMWPETVTSSQLLRAGISRAHKKATGFRSIARAAEPNDRRILGDIPAAQDYCKQAHERYACNQAPHKIVRGPKNGGDHDEH